jgi:hypothetical protein
MLAMRARVRILVAVVAVVIACDNRGEEGEPCRSDGFLGPSTCNGNLECNTAAGYVCERPRSRREGEPCSTDVLCMAGLFCPATSKCQPFLKEGDACFTPNACGPGLRCTKDPVAMTITCRPDPGR